LNRCSYPTLFFMMSGFFFFQAEDGIRDRNVTGVQTCALPISINHAKWNAKTFAVTNTITDLAPLIVIAFAAYQVIQGNLTLGTMVAFVAYMDQVYNPLRRLINSSTVLTQS